MACRLAEVWLLLLVFLLAATSGASFTAYPKTQGEEEIMKVMAVSAGQKDGNNGSSSSSPPPPSPAGNKQSSGGAKEKGDASGKEEGCVTAKECHMKRLVCAKKCTLAAHNKCAAKCSRACSSYPICTNLPFPRPPT